MSAPQNQPEVNPAPAVQPPVEPAAPQPPAPPQNRPPVVVNAPPQNNGEIVQLINALPEKLVDAVRELVPQNAPAPQQPAAPSQQPAAQPPTQPPATEQKRRSPGEWFFGVRK